MPQSYKKTTIIIGTALLLLTSASVIYLLLPHLKDNGGGFVAEIYQDGKLISCIPLNKISEPSSFMVSGKNGCTNLVGVRPGSICILSADCPDKLCVRQGFITDSRLPIVCLPNRLVIRLRPASDTEDPEQITPDIITY